MTNGFVLYITVADTTNIKWVKGKDLLLEEMKPIEMVDKNKKGSDAFLTAAGPKSATMYLNINHGGESCDILYLYLDRMC